MAPQSYTPDQYVWLSPFETNPRELCRLYEHPEGGVEHNGCVGGSIVHPRDPGDDGDREFAPEQIEGAAVYMITQCDSHHVLGFGRAVGSLEMASVEVKLLDRLFEKAEREIKNWTWTRLKKWARDSGIDDDTLQALWHYEGSDVYVCLDGVTYWINEADEWEAE